MASAIISAQNTIIHATARVGSKGATYCAIAGFVTSAIFALVIYPRIATVAGAGLDPDGHGALGWALWKYHAFSYFPSHRVSIGRGPLYPLIIAVLLKFSGGWWPYSVQLMQCLWFSLTCFFTFYIARRLWNSAAATVAGSVCVLHPFLFWYTGRIWIEAMAMFLFTALMAAVLHFQEKPALPRAVLLGFVIGCACLCK